ncbi:LysR family transcriptional regulator [Pinirhizobacter sp.]|jgi:DNA-binding transcriptional LysR family regulator|uniref:LysR family transcriptional regulator n=1 Tax=Pinirhizobacter sp. TaxID=2950432 RepID=UPI002F416A92
MDQLQAMQVFARVAELASFTRAADSLGMPKASASTAIQELEALLGTRLLHRTTRRVQPTQDGQAFYERVRDLLADVDEMQSMFRDGSEALRGRLRVDMPSSMARMMVVPRLGEWLARHPGLEIEVSSSDRRVDVVREGFDCVVRVGHVAESSLVARRLGAMRMMNCASSAYLQQYGEPVTLDDLAHHRLVHYVTNLGTRPEGFEYPAEGEYRNMPMAGVITVNSIESYQAACAAGLGIVQVPAGAMNAQIQAGTMVEILKNFPAEPMPVSLVYAHRRNLPRRVKAFMDWIEGVLRPYLDAP